MARERMVDELTASMKALASELGVGALGRSGLLTLMADWIALRLAGGGVLWIGGGPGSGKSTLLAQLIVRLDHERTVRALPFFFRRGRPDCGADRFLGWAAQELSWHLGLPEPPGAVGVHRFTAAVAAARRRGEAGPVRPIALLVDGLDALDEDAEVVAGALAAVRVPGLAVIVAARPEPALAGFISSAERLWPDGCPPPIPAQQRRAAFFLAVEQHIGSPAPKPEWLRKEAFIDALTARSGGFPLYVGLALADIGRLHDQWREAWALRRDDAWPGQPAGLAAIYASEVARMVGSPAGPASRILGVLALAEMPLPRADLATILAELKPPISGDDIQPALDALLPLLRVCTTPAGPDYGLIHDSLGDFVRREEALADACSEAEAALAAWCGNWAEHRAPYAVLHAGRHLADLARRDDAAWDRLQALGREDALLTAQEQLGGHLAALGTLRAAMRTAAERGDREATGEFCIRHAVRCEASRDASPLASYRRGDLLRTEGLAALAPAETRPLWAALLALHDADAGAIGPARDRLARLQDTATRTSGGLGGDERQVLLATFLAELLPAAPDLAVEVGKCALDDRGLAQFVDEAIRMGRLADLANIEHGIGGELWRSQTLRRMAAAHARAGRFAAAQSAALLAGRRSATASLAMRDVARARLDHGDLDGVLAMAEQARGLADRDWLYAECAAALAGRGQISRAMALAARIADHSRRCRAYGAVASELPRETSQDTVEEAFAAARGAAAAEPSGSLVVGAFETVIEAQFHRGSPSLGLTVEAAISALSRTGKEHFLAASSSLLKVLGRTADAGHGEVLRAVALADLAARQPDPSRPEAAADHLELLVVTGSLDAALAQAARMPAGELRDRVLRALAWRLGRDGRFEDAVRAAGRITGPDERDRALLAAVEQAAEAGLPDRARAILEAASFSDQLFLFDLRGHGQAAVVASFARTGQIREAVRLARTLPGGLGAAAWLGIGSKLREAGQKVGALAVWSRAILALQGLQQASEPPDTLPIDLEVAAALALRRAAERDSALGALAAARARDRGSEEGLRVIERMGLPGPRRWAMAEVARAQALAGGAGALAAGLERALAIDDPQPRQHALEGVALAFDRAGQQDRALAAVDSCELQCHREELLVALAVDRCERQDAEGAQRLAEMVTDADLRGRSVETVATLRVGQGDLSLISTLAALIPAARYPAFMARMARLLAVKREDVEGARRLLGKAREDVGRHSDFEAVLEASCLCAEADWELGDREAAIASYGALVGQAESKGPHAWRHLGDIACSQAATVGIPAALATCERILDSEKRAWVLDEILVNELQAGRIPSDELVKSQESYLSVLHMSWSPLHERHTANLARALARRGEFEASEAMARDVTVTYERNAALLDLATALLGAGREPEAIRVLTSITSPSFGQIRDVFRALPTAPCPGTVATLAEWASKDLVSAYLFLAYLRGTEGPRGKRSIPRPDRGGGNHS